MLEFVAYTSCSGLENVAARARSPQRVHDEVRRPPIAEQLKPSRKCQKSTAAYVLGRHSAHSLLMFGVAWRTYTYVILKWPSRW